MQKKVGAFEMWCYRRILKISWKDRVTNEEGIKSNASEVAFHGRHDKEENEICRTCAKRLEWFITSTDTGGYGGGKNESRCFKKNMDEGYVLMNRSGYI